MDALAGRTAIVTGGGNGIGRSIASRLADEGCDVGIFDIDEAGAHNTAAAIRQKGRQAHVAVGSVTRKDDVADGMASLLIRLQRVDILVNNAGILRIGKLVEISEKDWADSFQVNVDGVFWCCRAVLPQMISRRSGSVVNMASWLGKKGIAYYGAYCATKFAVVGLTQSLALEMAEHGVRVNAVSPGIIVETKMRESSEAMHRSQGLPTAAERVSSIPLGRLGYPDDVARVVAFLASDEAAYITGESINVSGGLWTN